MTITTFKASARGDDTFAADFPVTSKTANYTLVDGDIGKEIEFDKSSAVTCNLPSASTAGNGWNIILRNKGTGDLTVSPNGTDTIDGASSMTLVTGKWCWLRCFGSIWKCISQCCDGGTSSSKVSTYIFTDETDVSVTADAPTAKEISSLQNVEIPTKGQIRASVTGKFDGAVGGTWAIGGLEIDGTDYWFVWKKDGAWTYDSSFTNNLNDTIYEYQSLSMATNGVALDIETRGITTGSSVSMRPIFGRLSGSSANFEIKGTEVTTQVFVEIIDYT